jgi:hypothetical protein
MVARPVYARPVPEAATASELQRLEAELGRYLDEQRDVIVGRLARILVGMAVEAHHGSRSRNGRPGGPKRCSICDGLAAPARTICHSCRGRIRRQKERLLDVRVHEVEAARNGHRGVRAAELASGARVDPAQPFAASSGANRSRRVDR